MSLNVLKQKQYQGYNSIEQNDEEFVDQPTDVINQETSKPHPLKKLIKPFLIGAIVIFLFAIMFRSSPPKQFAFDTSFPADGSTWLFEVIQNENSTALAEVEARALDKLEMSPMYRCQNGIFGERWAHRPLSKRTFLLRIYKLVLQDASPPNPNQFIVRHQIFGFKAPMTVRYDNFTCADPKEDEICTVWDSVGYVSPFFTKRLTKGATSYPWYEQKLTLVPGSNQVEKPCPLVKEAWWCLWLFCPNA